MNQRRREIARLNAAESQWQKKRNPYRFVKHRQLRNMQDLRMTLVNPVMTAVQAMIDNPNTITEARHEAGLLYFINPLNPD